MADFADISLRPSIGSFLDGVHSDENVRASRVLVSQPGLELWTRYGFRRCDPLHCAASPAIPGQDRDVIRRLEEREDILRCRQ